MKNLRLLLVSCLATLAYCHGEHGDDHHLHENQIPPPAQQPSRENILSLLNEVFQLADKDGDKLLSADELKLWLDKVHKSLIKENVDQQWVYYSPTEQEVHSWEAYEPERQQTISWDQYLKLTYPEEIITAAAIDSEKPDEKIEKDQELKNYWIMYRRSLKRWKAADKNNDNVLIREEFINFVHPEEAEETKHLMVEEAMEDMDSNGDGEVTFQEYYSHMTEVSSDEEKADVNEFNQNQQSQFATYLDRDKDGVLNKEELKEWLTPDFDRHEAEAHRMIHDTDENHNLKLDKEEMVSNDNYYLSLIPTEMWKRYSSYGTTTPTPSHDEF